MNLGVRSYLICSVFNLIMAGKFPAPWGGDFDLESDPDCSQLYRGGVF